ncbi:hypothetical protein EW026_g1806 [Hermanssonia centrifuga]|uniref:Mechanosensitive ion channel protein n=1 Tax=Hermanssonia centrifuga TaxID=98765 RepID=A0A4S4KQ99_9APHY|nr:hypothetical protein EW026_g1806 [Hermanssonia centrifuga]
MPVSSMSPTTGTMLTQSLRGFSELQGHAIKNQDLLVASGAISLQGSESWSAVDEDIEAARASRGGAVTQDLLTPDMDLRQRDRELSEIAKSIASLAELFKDLSALVIDQGTLLDSVEYNIEQTAVQMSDAVKELDMATRAKPEHHRSPDSMSAHSDSPPHFTTAASILPATTLSAIFLDWKGEPPSTMPMPGQQSGLHPGSRNGSWDVLAGIRKFEHSYEEFDSSNASQSHLAFAEGDIPNNRFAKFYNYLLNVSIVTRWFLFIVPVMGLVWIPGILQFTTFPNGEIWGVKLLWWSIWLSVVWGGWWAALAVSMATPRLTRNTLGVVAVGARRYIDWLEALHRYVALFGWTLAIWISFQPLINTRQSKSADQSAVNIIDTAAKLLFAFFLCAAVLLGEKFSIQWIAGKFHERSYAERIADQKFALRVLSTLYRHSHDIPGRIDTLKDGVHDKRASMAPKRFLKKAFKGVKSAATTTTTALGTVASEIAGTSVLQPNSPQAKVQTALQSANKSRLLARRLFYSFVKPGTDYLIVEDIARYFPTPEDADAAFAIFDQDMNGDATRDEVEMTCLDFHREQLSIEHSMQDLDSAVGRLDNILMSVYFVVAILIIAVALEAQLVTLITGAGTLVLGLSWLIGSSLAEVLTSIIFLFVKHPYDVGDRVQIDKFLRCTGPEYRVEHQENIRRSPQMSESFNWDVAYSTTFEQIEQLRELMLAFLTSERRDYMPSFDVFVVDIPEQTKMTLKADIKYKSNFQQGALKAKRRNKWICALKDSLAKIKMFGPSGDPGAKPAPAPYTLVPWEHIKASDTKRVESPVSIQEHRIPEAWTFSDENAVLLDDSQDVFGEKEELNMANPRRQPSGPGIRQRPPPAMTMPSTVAVTDPSRQGIEEYELHTPRGADTFQRQQGQ